MGGKFRKVMLERELVENYERFFVLKLNIWILIFKMRVIEKFEVRKWRGINIFESSFCFGFGGLKSV